MVAVFGFFFQGAEADGFEGGGDVFFGGDFAGLGEGLVEEAIGDFADGFAGEHLLVCEDFEEDVAEAEDVHASVDVGVSPGELGRHIKRRAVAAADGGEGGVFVGAHFVGGEFGLAPHFGEAPIDNKRLAKAAY